MGDNIGMGRLWAGIHKGNCEPCEGPKSCGDGGGKSVHALIDANRGVNRGGE